MENAHTPRSNSSLSSKNRFKMSSRALSRRNSIEGFKATDRKVMKTPPFLPKKPTNEHISSRAPNLRLNKRAEERAKWEEQRIKREEQRIKKERESEEIRNKEEILNNIEIRKRLVHKAKPVMKSKFCLNVVKKPPTKPRSPAITKIKKPLLPRI